MAKTKAERMKAYRAKKKEQMGEKWLRQERERVRGYYVPTDELNEKKKSQRRLKNRMAGIRHYHKHKKSKETGADSTVGAEASTSKELQSDSVSSSGVDSSTEIRSTSPGVATLPVKFPFQSMRDFRSKGGSKRVSRALKRSKERIETLEDKNEDLQRKLKTVQRRLQRYEARKIPTTPRSKSDKVLKNAGINPNSVPEVRKRLIYVECINEEVKKAVETNTSMSRNILKTVSGNIIKKYRMKNFMQKMTSLNRRHVLVDKSMKVSKRKVMTEKITKMKEEVVDFYNRDDNSRMMPGKADAVKVGRGKQQKRVLNDYLSNLFLKYKAESNYNMSFSTFCRLRPNNVSLVNFASRSVCLCSKHQNFSYKLKALNNLGATTVTSPDAFVESYKHSAGSFDELLKKIPQGDVKYFQWKRVKLQNNKERMRIVENNTPRDDFIATMKKEFEEFDAHVDRVKKQYKSVKDMKQKLPNNHILIQMDFSENYTCQTVEEIQSAYWNSSMVTLHPTILYFNNANGDMDHKSLVFVSEILQHNASMVSAIVHKTVQVAKQCVPDLKHVHFWTDSPSSQYRNKSVFDLVNRFELEFGCKASWHYFESGHGKSACDGVGGTTKRNADNAVKQNKAVIQDANDFYAWAIQHESDISYIMITSDEYETSFKEVESRKELLKPIKGTMLVHAIAVDKTGKLVKRNTSCACDNCFSLEGFNGESECLWDTVTMKSDDRKPTEENTTTTDTDIDSREVQCKKGDFVIAVYEDKCYVGKVLEIDETDQTVNVDFMTQCGKIKNRYKWPSTKDTLWVKVTEILRLIDAPVATGKAGRMFCVQEDVVQFIDSQSF